MPSRKVELSGLASMQYDKFLAHIYFVLKNPQAADNLMQDFDDTIEMLGEHADHFGYCRSERLRKLGFHKVHFKKHRYLLCYPQLVGTIQLSGGRRPSKNILWNF